MAITQRNFTNNSNRPNHPNSTNIPDDPTERTPEEKRKEREQEQIRKKIETLNKKMEKLKKNTERSIMGKIQEIAYIFQSKIAEYNPNDDPDYLYNQISPILGKLRLRGRIDKGKGDIVIFMDKKRGDEYYYQVKIRREQNLNKQDIDRLDREKPVDRLTWDSDGILLYLWGPYTLPVTEQEEETPGTPESGI
jgi:arginyl-tRNA synthetase